MMATHARTIVPSARADFAADVAMYLQMAPRQLPSRYFYDPLGSALFEAICRLPWYHITRAETALLERHAPQIVSGLGTTISLCELGGGNGEKLATLIERSGHRYRRAHLIDISEAALDQARSRLMRLPADACDRVTTFHGSYEEGLDRLGESREGAGAWLALFLGSNIGNFDPPGALTLLRQIRGALREGDALLLGTDLVKPEAELLLAYDDPLQVTAAFNLNLLDRINRELGGTFDLAGFRHRAVWNADESRVEMHLVSTRRQTVRIEASDLDVTLARDEWIWTESSYKWEPQSIVAAGSECGFRVTGQWIDDEAGFALTRFVV